MSRLIYSLNRYRGKNNFPHQTVRGQTYALSNTKVAQKGKFETDDVKLSDCTLMALRYHEIIAILSGVTLLANCCGKRVEYKGSSYADWLRDCKSGKARRSIGSVMHYKIAIREASNKQKTRDCKGKLRQIERTIIKPKNGARNHQKEFEDLIVENSQDTHSDFDIKDEPGVDSGLEGDNEELDGMGLDDLLDDLLPNEVTIPTKSLNVQQNLNTMAEFLMKNDEDVASNVDFPDFTICFNGEQKCNP
ncbi:uncharacterized protein LOC120129219 [Hibiscus syriacus]|uniref:uncharacterized protein LOC120129219 n=1 Tax=Hibiscus syriacus TaxID=106335 RepID=UPI0019206A68|nr:uncharacterized protein LOC120129219 [Hibiscus syriacus]